METKFQVIKNNNGHKEVLGTFDTEASAKYGLMEALKAELLEANEATPYYYAGLNESVDKTTYEIVAVMQSN